MMLVFTTIAAFLVAASGAPDSCPPVKPVSNFDMDNFVRTKRWFELARYAFDFERDADCVTYDYNVVGGEIQVDLREVVKKNATVVSATLYPTDEKGKVLFSIHRTAGPNVTTYVIDTDNKNYVIFYYCLEKIPTQPLQEIVWILSSTPSLAPEVRSQIDKFANETHLIDEKNLVWDQFTHEDCQD